MQILKGYQDSIFRLVLFGQAGVGKSTLAAAAPCPLFIDLDRGTRQLNVDRITPNTYEEFIEACILFKNSEYKTLVIDTIDHLDQLLQREICSKHEVENIVDIGYGKGYDYLSAKWQSLIKALDNLNKNYILIGQEKVSKLKDIEVGVDYDKMSLTINEKSAKLIISAVDALFYCRWDTAVNQEKNIIKNSGNRIIVTVDSGANFAKNRYRNINKIEPMDGSIYQKITKPITTPEQPPARPVTQETQELKLGLLTKKTGDK